MIFREKGSLMMLVVAFIYSFTSILGKICILHSNPRFFGALYFTALAIFLLPVTWKFSKLSLGQFFRMRGIFLGVALCYTMMILCHFYAIRLIEASLMIAVKRTSLLFGVVYGWVVFKETHLRQHLIGALVILFGVYLIASSS